MAKKLKRHYPPYSDQEIDEIHLCAKQQRSARETAKLVGRTLGGLKFWAQKNGVSFRSIAQVSRQKALAKRRKKYGMTATLKG